MHEPPVRPSLASSRRGEWLSLGPASRLLGVDADTLRRWADAGRVEVFTTPGGHRRFSRRSIERLIRARRPSADASVARLGATTDRLSAAYRRRAVSHAPFRVAAQLEPSAREAIRLDGRGLVDSLVRYLDAADPATRESIESEAAELAADLARRLADAGLPLSDAVARFVVAREPLLEELARTAHRRRLDADRLAVVFGDASSVLDRLLLVFIAAHEAAAGARAVGSPGSGLRGPVHPAVARQRSP